MTPEQVRSIVNSALSDKVVMSWTQMGIVILLAAISTFISAYLIKKAGNLATKEDVRNLTDTVESVKLKYAKELESHKAKIAQNNTAKDARIKLEGVLEFWLSTLPTYSSHKKFWNESLLAIKGAANAYMSYCEVDQKRAISGAVNSYANLNPSELPYVSLIGDSFGMSPEKEKAAVAQYKAGVDKLRAFLTAIRSVCDE